MPPCFVDPYTIPLPESDTSASPGLCFSAHNRREGSAASRLPPYQSSASDKLGRSYGGSSSEAQSSLPAEFDHQNIPQRHFVATEDINEPSPLPYQSQLFPHRDGPSNQQGSTLTRSHRQETFLAQSSSFDNGHADRHVGYRVEPSSNGKNRGTTLTEPELERALRSNNTTAGLENEVTIDNCTQIQDTTLRYQKNMWGRQVRHQESEAVYHSHKNFEDVAPQRSTAFDPSVARDDWVGNGKASNYNAVDGQSNGGDVTYVQPPDSGVRAPRGVAMFSAGATDAWPSYRAGDEYTTARLSRHGAGGQVPGRRNSNSSMGQPLPSSNMRHVDRYEDHYGSLVDRLGKHMPQLVHTREPSCRVPIAGDITCYDTLSSGGPPRLVGHISYSDLSTSQLEESLRNLRPERAYNVRSRHILVEDLSPLLIEHLGNTFWLNPEFFEEHLNRSGYRPDSYNDPLPSTWNTSGTPKDYVSVRWFRPVHRNRIKPVSELERDKLLKKDNGNGSLDWFSLSDGAKYKNKVRLLTNIFRKEWPLVSDPDQIGWAGDAVTFPLAWEERATIHVLERGGQPPVFIILLDPLPSLHLTSKLITTRSNSEDSRNLVPFLQAYSRAPIGPKLGLIDVFNGLPLNEATISMLGSNLASTNCTRDDLTLWLESMHTVHPNNADMDLVTGLLWIIHRDTIGFLHFVHTVIEEIGLHSTDDYILQTRLTHWRGLITRFQTELPAMKLSITELFRFLQRFQPLYQAQGFVEKTIADIDEMIVQIEKSYTALRADMALLESKRGINQAESVGKLTELGFIFIPISCIASLFSMQVQPLADPVPLYAVVIAIFLTIGMIYAVRLCVRSTALEEYRREKAEEIRLYAKLPPGSPIPARTFILYMVRDQSFYKGLLRSILGPITTLLISLLALTACMLPVIMLWFRNKHMDVRYKGTLTVVFFAFCSAALYPLAKHRVKKTIDDPVYEREGQILKKIRDMGSIAKNDNAPSEPMPEEQHSNTNLERRHFWRNMAQRAFGKRTGKTSDAEAHRTGSISAGTSSDHSVGVRPTARERKPPLPTPPRIPFSVEHPRRANTIARWRDQVTPGDGVELVEVIGNASPTGQHRHRSNDVPADPSRILLPPSAETLNQAS